MSRTYGASGGVQNGCTASHKVITLNKYPHYQPANTGTDHLSWLGRKSFTEVHNPTKWHVDDVQEAPQGHFVENQN